MPYDPSTDVGQLRFSLGDTTEPFVYSDEELNALLSRSASLDLAIASGLEAKAASLTSFLAKKGLDLELQDIPAMLRELRALAKQKRELGTTNDSSFALAEQVVNGSSARERLYKQRQRQGG